MTNLVKEQLESTKEIFTVISIATLANFLTGFNARLAIVGLPTIMYELSADVFQLIWVIQGFMLGSTAIQLIVGKLADQFGRVKLFNFGILVFSLGTLAAGLSTNPLSLIISRIIQGIGGAFLISLTVTILADSVSPSRLATWLGLSQVAWRAGALMGLTISGFIIDYLGWRWIFLIQLPLGLFALTWSLLKLRERYKPSEKPFIDLIGFISFTVAIVSILLGLTFHGYGLLEESLYILLLGLAVMAFFIIWELKSKHPALDLRVFKIWQFSGGIVSQLLYSIGFGASLTLLAIYLQSVDGFTPSQTGLLLIPFELTFLVFGLIGGRLADAIGFAPVAATGLAIGSIALYKLSTMNTLTEILLGEFLLGAGTGLFVSPNTGSIMNSVPPHRRGVASSLRTVSFQIGFIASLNIAILSMTQILPYEVVSALITHRHTTGLNNNLGVEICKLSGAIKHSLGIQAFIMALGIPFTISRLTLKRKNVGK
ncbi:MAG: MFS transporter [Candidatus Korarchaeota archaeon]